MNFLLRIRFYRPTVSLAKTTRAALAEAIFLAAAWRGVLPPVNTKLKAPCGRVY
jgi:hypothetical protein